MPVQVDGVMPGRRVGHSQDARAAARDRQQRIHDMAGGGLANPNRFPLFMAMPKLSDEEINQLVSFLKALSGQVPVYSAPTLP